MSAHIVQAFLGDDGSAGLQCLTCGSESPADTFGQAIRLLDAGFVCPNAPAVAASQTAETEKPND